MQARCERDSKKCCLVFPCSAQNDLHFKELEIIEIQNYEVHVKHFNFSVDKWCNKWNSILKKQLLPKVALVAENKNKKKMLSGKKLNSTWGKMLLFVFVLVTKRSAFQRAWNYGNSNLAAHVIRVTSAGEKLKNNRSNWSKSHTKREYLDETTVCETLCEHNTQQTEGT